MTTIEWPISATAMAKNGGVVILHSSLELCPETPLDNTLLVVATDNDLATLLREYPGGIDDIHITIENEHGPNISFTAGLQWVDHEQLIGQTNLTGQPVHVVSHSYALRKRWTQTCN
ncbi:MAG: hypothetical protein NTZ90_05510 [Proteobacteria bacterium]|nr:hypothetical protein [Pseudomonadota bacterium]